ncbi:hypothetical protein ANOM_006993 [Aspergillus nomiae NRRL 13137]|uniref:DNA2/NAM7 helicase-like C-terminal domain-containing protein n=1 Tax=Aspergillus nomiae NRRL (strain ATCC 15546 / NRRL 13137 / CBS 260.88 / M93) TaxID=1509407 RepID=A0A0L1IYU7_ASPN3|nr:uncharacterized protein ANOM_006993 [Aspergillus nomiae NRRL 13137]KNG84684.1 hypothetical protein ANOM_006993 [Aspergillus nomiae NRRL 13137]
MLQTNDQNHSQILDLFNREMYRGEFVHGPGNDRLERVGRVRDSFPGSRHWFRALNVHGVRQLFISVIGVAKRMKNSLSWSNETQGDVLRHLLTSLYSFQTPNGDLRTYRDNLTVDAAQGQEAPSVVFLMTKPSQNVASAGFMADANRLNIALSRAKKVMIIIGNLRDWNNDGIDKMH